MEQNETTSRQEGDISFDKEISELIYERILFAESTYARLPISVEVYDSKGVLRSINDHALKMYGVDDRNTVLNKVNLFNSPYVDDELLAKILKGDDITLEFEYDFDQIEKDAYYESNNKDSMIYEVKIVAIWNKAGKIIGHMLLSNDVTAIREVEYRTEESKKNLEMAMDAANMSSWVYDIHKEVFKPLYGEPIVKGSMTLNELKDRLHPQDRSLLEQTFSQLINQEIQYGHVTLRCYDNREGLYRYYESRMRLSTEHLGKLQIVGTELDVTERMQIAKEAQDLATKRELAMKVSNIVHWDFDVWTQRFESYNDPLNNYVDGKLLTISEYLNAIYPEDRSFFKDAIQAMLAGKDETINFTCRMQTKYDKTWQYCDFTCVPFEKDENGHIIRFTGFRQNIPKLQQLNRELKERNNKIELSFKTIGMSYWDFDVKSQQFKAFNDSVNDFDPEKTIYPQDYMDVAHPDDMDTVRKCLGHMLQGIDKDFNFKYRSKTRWDEEWQTLLVTGIQVESDKDGRITRYTGITINNTKWEKVIQELQVLKDKAELSDRLKSAFLANMSHEIRTPLNAIIGFSELLAESDDREEQMEYMNIIKSNNELLLRLINDILDLSKIESGSLERRSEKFNLDKVANELYLTIRPKIANADVKFIQNSPVKDCSVFLDRSRLKQVWMNFLTNAVKYTSSGYIKMGYLIEGKGIRIYVEDSGIGIPKELHGKVFERFQKFNDFVQGTGLGLAISKAIAEAAGGKVGFSSEAGVGSTFWAWFPCEVNL